MLTESPQEPPPYVLIGIAALLASALIVAPAGRWPWDHDEVHSLMELGRIPLTSYPGPTAQLRQMHRLVPVFYVLQNAALAILPQNEWGTRMLPSVCGVIVAVLAFVVGLRTRTPWFAWSLFVLIAGSPTLVWLSQFNRFYTLALLFNALTFVFVWIRDDGWTFDALAVASGMAALLSHNLTLVVFGLTFCSVAIAWILGRGTRLALRRSLLVLAATGAVYFVYLRPLMTDWISGNTGGTSPIVSFAAQVGITPLALAIPGCLAAWKETDDRWSVWWLGLFVSSLAFVAASPFLVGNWNPRYGLFFMPPIWVLGAMGASMIADALQTSMTRVAWLITILVLLAPKLVSHFVDGSRHDFRSAAAVIATQNSQAPVLLSNWPAELQYYLEPMTGQQARYWGPGEPIPDSGAVIAIGSNAWEPMLHVAGRSVNVIGVVGRRRLDEQSHLIRIYAIAPVQH